MWCVWVRVECVWCGVCVWCVGVCGVVWCLYVCVCGVWVCVVWCGVCMCVCVCVFVCGLKNAATIVPPQPAHRTVTYREY